VETIRGVEVDIVNRLEDYDRSLKENQVGLICNLS
jgi:hypothetical protein